MPDSARTVERRERLLAWYDQNRRDLPWRAAPGQPADPYAVWVSEVMLQQTRVETVRPYFERWMGAFPTVDALAAAAEDSVLKMWEGLGYYSRARNLHRAVREVASTYGGRVPSEVEQLRALPGVGRYTAGAVASIAFGQQSPVVDGNVRRVFARLLDLPNPTDGELWEYAGRMVTGERPGDLNQALMELGAMVCIPGSPRCDECPLRDSCGALATGTVEERPARTAAKAVPVEHHGVAVVVADDSRVLLVKRPGKGRLAGLWEFPGVQSQPDETPADTAFRAYLTTTGEYSDQSTPVLTPLCTISHAFTHVRVVYQAFVLPISAADKANPAEPGPTEFIPSEKNASGDSSPIVTALSPKGSSSASSEHPGRAEPMVSAWVEFSAISSYPLPRAQQKIAAALLERVRG